MAMSATLQLAAARTPVSLLDPGVGDELRELEAHARALADHTQAENTRRAYAKAWRSFAGFCQEHRLEPLPAHPETVRWYVAWMSVQHDDEGRDRFAVSTIRQYLAGVADRHVREGFLDPTGHRGVVDLVRGLAHLRAVRPQRKRPLLLEHVVQVISAMEHDVYPAGVPATRDAAVLWLGFAGALRRGEVAALRLSSLELHPADGIHIRVGRSKTDQDNTGPDLVVLPYGSTPRTCPPCAVHRWLSLLRIAAISDASQRRQTTMRQLFGYQLREHVCGADGSLALASSADLASGRPLIRAAYRNRHNAAIGAGAISGDALNTMLQTRLREAGIGTPGAHGFHSLRAGHVTQARRNGATTTEIMRQGRWRRAETVDVYDREGNPLARNSVTHLGL